MDTNDQLKLKDALSLEAVKNRRNLVEVVELARYWEAITHYFVERSYLRWSQRISSK